MMEREPRGIEKLIQDAQKEGKFDDLEHKGEPLHVAFGDLASVANDVMRDNGVVPEWIELARAIEGLRERQAELIAGLEQRLQEFQQRFPALALTGADGDWQLHEQVEPLDRALLTDGPDSPTPRSGRPGQQIEALGRMRSIHRKPPPIG